MNAEQEQPQDDTGEQARYEAVLAADPDQALARDSLFRALYDPSWRVRKAAADRLRQAGNPQQILPRLLSVLGDRGQTGARNAAAEALVLIGAPAVDALVALLQHEDPDQRKFAADILGPIGSREAEPALVRALGDPDPNVRVSVAEALGQVGGERASTALARVLGCGDALLELSALEALMRLETPATLPVLFELVKRPLLRRAATRALGLVPQPEAREAISRALGADSPVIREAALGAIGLQVRHGSPESRQALASDLRPLVQRETRMLEWLDEGLGSEDVEAVRGALFCHGLLSGAHRVRQIAEAAEDARLSDDALKALVQRGPDAARALATELETLGASARVVAAEALVQLAEPSLVPVFEKLSDSVEAEIRMFAVKALGRSQSVAALGPVVAQLGDPELGPTASRAVIELAQSFPHDARAELESILTQSPSAAALRAWAAVAGAEALPQLRRAARDADASLRSAAAEAVGILGSAAEEVTELLRVALSDESVEVRVAAASGLGRIPSQVAEPLLQIALADRDPAVVCAAIEAAASGGLVQAGPKLAVLIRAADGAIAGSSVRALSRLGLFDDAALYAATLHLDPSVVAEALDAGAALPEAIPLALRLLRHPHWQVRTVAARVLGRSASGELQVLEAIDAALSEEQDSLVRSALEAARAQHSRR